MKMVHYWLCGVYEMKRGVLANSNLEIFMYYMYIAIDVVDKYLGISGSRLSIHSSNRIGTVLTVYVFLYENADTG